MMFLHSELLLDQAAAVDPGLAVAKDAALLTAVGTENWRRALEAGARLDPRGASERVIEILHELVEIAEAAES